MHTGSALGHFVEASMKVSPRFFAGVCGTCILTAAVPLHARDCIDYSRFLPIVGTVSAASTPVAVATSGAHAYLAVGNQEVHAGPHALRWDDRDTSGAYFLQLRNAGGARTQRLAWIR